MKSIFGCVVLALLFSAVQTATSGPSTTPRPSPAKAKVVPKSTAKNTPVQNTSVQNNADLGTRPGWMQKAPESKPKKGAIKVKTTAALVDAVASVPKDGTIVIAKGTYEAPSERLWLKDKTGVTIRGESNDPRDVILKGRGFYNVNESDDILVIQGCTDVTVANITFMDCHSYGVKLENVQIGGHGLKNISIVNCNFRDFGMRGIKGTMGEPPGPNVGGRIQYCYFENQKVPKNEGGWHEGGNYVTSIDCMWLQDWTISDNYFKNIKGISGGARGAIFVWNNCKNVISERNVFVGCDRSICYGNPSGNRGTTHVAGGIIRNNFVVVGADTAVELCWVEGIKVYNNTVLTPEPRLWVLHWFPPVKNCDVQNNIMRGRTGGNDPINLKNNVERAEDDWFVNVREGNLHLKTADGSLSHKAVKLAEVADDFDSELRGANPDIGADQHDAKSKAPVKIAKSTESKTGEDGDLQGKKPDGKTAVNKVAKNSL